MKIFGWVLVVCGALGLLFLYPQYANVRQAYDGFGLGGLGDQVLNRTIMPLFTLCGCAILIGLCFIIFTKTATADLPSHSAESKLNITKSEPTTNDQSAYNPANGTPSYKHDFLETKQINSLITRCPSCQTSFVISTAQLTAYDGAVKCGFCTSIFDGKTNLESSLPTLTERPTGLSGFSNTTATHAAENQNTPSVIRQRT